MIKATPAGTAPDNPYHYTPFPHATKAEIEYCTHCPVPGGCDEKHELCQYNEANKDDDLDKQITRHLHQIVNTPVYRAHRGINEALGR